MKLNNLDSGLVDPSLPLVLSIAEYIRIPSIYYLTSNDFCHPDYPVYAPVARVPL